MSETNLVGAAGNPANEKLPAWQAQLVAEALCNLASRPDACRLLVDVEKDLRDALVELNRNSFGM